MIYLDYASTTPVDRRVLNLMKKYFSQNFGNPSSLHKIGQSALKALDQARNKIKEIIEATYTNEMIFTSSATESNNLAIKGLAFYCYFRLGFQPHIISSTIEHPSVIEVLKDLTQLRIIEYDLIKPQSNGLIDPQTILSFIKNNTILITFHYVNSEIGVIQKIKEISKLIENLNQQRERKIIFHIDAAQAPLTEDVSVRNLKVDMMTISSHKIYGPKGVALLYKKNGIILERILSGSEQEFGLRPGTEALPLIVAFAKALEIVSQEREQIRKHLLTIRDYFLRQLKINKIKFQINGDIKNSSPKIINLYFPKRTSQEILLYLDQKNILVSSGMACKARAMQPSYIIDALYPHTDRSTKSIRFSFGRETKKGDIDYLVKVLASFLR